MKKPIALIAAALLTVSLAACSHPAETETTKPGERDHPKPLGNRYVAYGWEMAVQDVDFDATFDVTSRPGGNPNPDPGNKYAIADVNYVHNRDNGTLDELTVSMFSDDGELYEERSDLFYDTDAFVMPGMPLKEERTVQYVFELPDDFRGTVAIQVEGKKGSFWRTR